MQALLNDFEDAEDAIHEARSEIEDLTRQIDALYSEIDDLESERADWKAKKHAAENKIRDIQGEPEYQESIVQYWQEEVQREHARQRLRARYGVSDPDTIRDFFTDLKAFTPRTSERLRELKP